MRREFRRSLPEPRVRAVVNAVTVLRVEIPTGAFVQELPGAKDTVTAIAEVQRQRHAVRQRRHLFPGREIVAVDRLRIEPREETLAGRTAHGHRSMGIGETHTLFSQAVDMGCLHLGMILRVQNPVVQIIAYHKQNVHRLPPMGALCLRPHRPSRWPTRQAGDASFRSPAAPRRVPRRACTGLGSDSRTACRTPDSVSRTASPMRASACPHSPPHSR